MTDSTGPRHTGAASIASGLRHMVGWGFRTTARLRHGARAAQSFSPPAPSTRPVIVMVHGFEGCPGELAPLYTALQASLGSSCDLAVVDTLDPGMGDTPEENAAALDTYLTTHGLHGRPLFFIGHSLGGLIIRCYLARVISGPHPNVTVRGVVMLGTPNGGVQAWNLLPIHWMRAATFAERFNAVYPLPAGTRGRNLLEARPNDGVVSLHSAQQLTGEHVTLRTYPLDHWELLADGAVTEDVVRFIMEQGWTG